MNFHVVIPARFASTRLPGKPLLDIGGRPMILHTVERAQLSGAQQVVVATDDERIAEVCTNAGVSVAMTSTEHKSGSDRVAEVARLRNWASTEVVVNVQGDEPLISPLNISQVAQLLEEPGADIATLAVLSHSERDRNDPNCVKVVLDQKGLALYFSRTPIPYDRASTERPGQSSFLRHVGIYAYRVASLAEFANTSPCELEQIECLEQLRALWQGWPIRVAVAKDTPAHGVDTAEDLERVRTSMELRGGSKC